MRALLLMVPVLPLGAQSPVAVRVSDQAGAPVAHAVVAIAKATPVIADDSGRVYAKLKSADSVRVTVRRMGFQAFDGWTTRGADGVHAVTLTAMPYAAGAVTVTARAETPLAQRGFYDRAERVRRGAIVGEFITPEELSSRNAMQVSQVLQGRRTVRIKQVRTATPSGAVNMRSQPVLVGRGGCIMTLIIDGQVVQSSAQDIASEDAPTSVFPIATRQGTTQGGSMGDQSALPIAMDVDELVNGSNVMGIEIYPSAANAPAELQSLAGRGSCGIVAIWTGPRQ